MKFQLFRLKRILISLIKQSKYKKINSKTSKRIQKTYECHGYRKFALVVGNGPSVNLFELSSFDNADLYVCNHFYKHPQYLNLNIFGYFMLDPYSSISGLQESIDILKNALKNLNVKFFIIHGSLFQHSMEIQYLFSQDKRLFMVYPNDKIQIILTNRITINKMPFVNHTPIMALFFTLWNYKNIKLIGLDHTELRGLARGINKVEHFYKVQDKEKQLMDEHWYERVISTGITFDQYLSIAKYAKINSIEILQLNMESDLKMFNA